MRRLTQDVPRRAVAVLGALGAILVAVPWFANDYLLTVLIIMLYFAYTGQAWNVMMGFAGQLSLGHALYVGLGAYAAAALYVHFGIAPWIGLAAAIALTWALERGGVPAWWLLPLAVALLLAGSIRREARRIRVGSG